MKNLPVDELYGVGKVTAKKLHELGLKTCADLQAMSLIELIDHFSEKSGNRLYEQCRGIDNREVEPNRIRKSLSVEQTFKQDIDMDNQCLSILHELYDSLTARLKRQCENRPIKNQCIKIKLSDFKIITLERVSQAVDFPLYENLLFELINRSYGKIRLMGIGVHFI